MAEEDKKVCTLQEVASMAIGCQNACNASGLVHSLSEKVMPALWAESREGTGRGTSWINCHPVMILFLDKLADLAGLSTDSTEKYRWAVARCDAYSKGEGVPEGQVY